MKLYDDLLKKINEVKNTDIKNMLVETLDLMSETYDLEDHEESKMVVAHIDNTIALFNM